MMESWHSYPSIYALGHRYVSELLLDPVLVQEKVDGSQFSFGLFADGYRCRSKGAQINVLAPDKMFSKGVQQVMALPLREGWTYRGEYLAKPKHNALAYERVPAGNVILFDISTGHEEYASLGVVQEEAARLGLEVVPTLHEGMVTDIQMFRELLARNSVLGGQKIEGVVVKNYARFGVDKHVLMGKFVSEAFKEVHAKVWKMENPGAGDIVQQLGEKYHSAARWGKAVQHLREAGKLDGSPKDIGLLFAEVPEDIKKECEEEIKEVLFAWAWPKVRRAVTAGLPEWYKDKLLEQQFEKGEE